MPKIKIYEGNGTIIPVARAKIITGYECPWTGKIFSKKKAYVKHLGVFRRDHIHFMIRRRNRDRIFQELINQSSFEKIIEWIESHPEFVFDGLNVSLQESRAFRDKFTVKITYLELSWSNNVSNSHDCPRGGVTNWGRKDKLKDGSPAPTGYPGWHGRIEYKVNHRIGFGSDIMAPLGIHTGTGGGRGNNEYGYDVKIFSSDWPGLEKSRLFNIIKGETSKMFTYGEKKYFRY